MDWIVKHPDKMSAHDLAQCTDVKIRPRPHRRSARKSHNGCVTCKIRKIKCDEAHPACRRCMSTGRKCDGYVNDPMRQVSVYNHRTQAQFQALNFFIDQVLPSMTHIVDTDFWNRFLLQASYTDSTVWLATTSMSELIRQLRPGNADRRLALQWYSCSINELQTQMKYQMKWSVVCSITAILYICIECLLDNMVGALTIYQRATQQINGAKNDALNASIMPLLQHIAIAHGLQIPPQPISTEYISMSDARDMLYELIGATNQFLLQVEDKKQSHPKHWVPPTDLINRRDHFLARLRSWASATTRVHDKSCHALAWSCMYLAQLTYVIWLSAIMDTEMAFDKHHPDFEQLLDHANSAITATPHSVFSFETRVIPSLGFVATRCRHPIIRRRAIQLLCCGPQIENTRSAVSTIALAKRIVAIEESGCVTGAYCREPVNLALPPEMSRLASARVENKIDSLGHTEQVLRFRRWRVREDEWFITNETTRI